MKKIMVLTLCTLATMLMVACGENKKEDTPALGENPSTWGPALENTEAENTEEEKNVEISNPYEEVTLEEAIKVAGFDCSVPENVSGYNNRVILVSEDGMIQARYYNTEDEQELSEEDLESIDWEKYDFRAHDLLIRKAKGNEDISGDYNEYNESNSLTIEEKEVTVKGNDGKIHVAIWTEGEYTFAIDIADGLTSEELVEIISHTK